MNNIKILNNQNFKDWSAESIATMFVGLLFGWETCQDGEVPDEYKPTGADLVMHFYHSSLENLSRDQLIQVADGMDIPNPWNMTKSDLCAEIAELEASERSIDAMVSKDRKDTEVEAWAFGELEKLSIWHLKAPLVQRWALLDNQDAYFTTTGENPVTKDMAAIADEMSTAAGFCPQDLMALPDRDIADHYVAPAYATYQGMKRRERHFHSWIRWIWDRKANPEALKPGWKAFWKKYFDRKKNGTVMEWLAPRQIATIRKEFEKLGVKA